MPIYVNTDKKRFNARKAGNASDRAEAKMQKAVQAVFEKADGFTTTKPENGRGYSIRQKVTKIEIIGQSTKCSVLAEISKYPPVVNKDGDETETMSVSASLTGTGTVEGTSEGALLDCIEATARDVAKKSLTPIRNHDAANK